MILLRWGKGLNKPILISGGLPATPSVSAKRPACHGVGRPAGLSSRPTPVPASGRSTSVSTPAPRRFEVYLARVNVLRTDHYRMRSSNAKRTSCSPRASVVVRAPLSSIRSSNWAASSWPRRRMTSRTKPSAAPSRVYVQMSCPVPACATWNETPSSALSPACCRGVEDAAGWTSTPERSAGSTACSSSWARLYRQLRSKTVALIPRPASTATGTTTRPRALSSATVTGARAAPAKLAFWIPVRSIFWFSLTTIARAHKNNRIASSAPTRIAARRRGCTWITQAAPITGLPKARFTSGARQFAETMPLLTIGLLSTDASGSRAACGVRDAGAVRQLEYRRPCAGSSGTAVGTRSPPRQEVHWAENGWSVRRPWHSACSANPALSLWIHLCEIHRGNSHDESYATPAAFLIASNRPGQFASPPCLTGGKATSPRRDVRLVAGVRLRSATVRSSSTSSHWCRRFCDKCNAPRCRHV